MKIIVTGADGQLGSDVMTELEKRGIEAVAAVLPEIDITNREKTLSFIISEAPDAVIHCAAYTNVDRAESERELCRAVNEDGTKNIVEACRRCSAKLLYISTDYVFGGEGEKPFETGDAVSPCNYYGETKLLGEKAVSEYDRHFIIRTSWVFGKNGRNFVKTMLKLAAEKDEIKVVCDQIGSPTYTPDLASLICDVIKTEKYGTYHATNEGYCSWAEFAAGIMRASGSKTKITPITSDEYKSDAVRPENSRLSKRSLDENGFERLPDWQNALARFLEK